MSRWRVRKRYGINEIRDKSEREKRREAKGGGREEEENERRQRAGESKTSWLLS